MRQSRYLRITGFRAVLMTTLVLTSACVGVPRMGAQALRPADVPPTPTLVTQAPPTQANTNIDRARSAEFDALAKCNSILISIPTQQFLFKRSAYSSKQLGLLLTTVVGVAGSIVTAVLVNNQKDDQTATIVGASTAGATSVAGVLSLFVVGSGTDERIQLMSDYAKQIQDAQATYKTACGTLSDANAEQCKMNANLLKNTCETVGGKLPYKP